MFFFLFFFVTTDLWARIAAPVRPCTGQASTDSQARGAAESITENSGELSLMGVVAVAALFGGDNIILGRSCCVQLRLALRASSI